MERGEPSRTARNVAAHRLEFARVAVPYGDPEADEALARDVAGGMAVSSSRMHEYLRTRTSFFDRAVAGELDRGIRQVVVGGAGYDGRAFRYAKPGVRWFEVDHPATQADKLERLRRLGIRAPHVRFVAADFATDPIADRLLDAGLDASSPALFLLEGVAVYLDEHVLASALRQFHQATAAGASLAISVLVVSGTSQAQAGFRARVAALGEPTRSGLSVEETEELLVRAGWRLPAAGDDRWEKPGAAGLLLARW